jgi:hypothetical protein
MRPTKLVEIRYGRVRLNWRKRRAEWAQLYIEPRDIWVGAYVSEHAVFVCPLPCVVIKVWRKVTS